MCTTPLPTLKVSDFWTVTYHTEAYLQHRQCARLFILETYSARASIAPIVIWHATSLQVSWCLSRPHYITVSQVEDFVWN
jgi:hypothetical protein